MIYLNIAHSTFSELIMLMKVITQNTRLHLDLMRSVAHTLYSFSAVLLGHVFFLEGNMWKSLQLQDQLLNVASQVMNTC